MRARAEAGSAAEGITREAVAGLDRAEATAGLDSAGGARTTRPTDDARRIFTGIAGSYDRVGAALSFGQDPRWRAALVEFIDAKPTDRVLDVATGTGLVAQALHDRYRCAVVGLDQSADMLRLARTRAGVFEALIEGSADRLPFADGTFDHLTFTYLLRYVDNPAATMRELVRVVKPGGRVAMVEFGVPEGLWRPLWRLYTRVGLPLAGRLVSRQWFRVGRFLGPNIERFHARHPIDAVESDWRAAGLVGVHARRMSVGGGFVMTGVKVGDDAAPVADGRDVAASVVTSANADAASPAIASPAISRLAPAFYAARPGGWRDYWTLLHPPYTAWHLSYVLLGAALAFGLAVGVAAHAFDELNGRPLRTRIPSWLLVALGGVSLLGATALGVVAATIVGTAFLAFVAAGAAIVLLYAFDVPPVHSDLGFAVGWGAFPVAATAFAVGAHPLAIVVASLGATLLSLAQRRLSTRARSVRRRAVRIAGEIRYADGTREPLDARALIGAPEAALSVLWLASLAFGLAALLARWL